MTYISQKAAGELDSTQLLEKIYSTKTLAEQLEPYLVMPTELIVALVVLSVLGGPFLILAVCGKKTQPFAGMASLCFILGLCALFFWPANPEKVKQAAKIVAVATERPPHKVIEKWINVDKFERGFWIEAHSGMKGSMRRLQYNLSTLEDELATREFKQSGDFEKLKKEILEKALEAQKQGKATPGQLAVIAQLDNNN